MGLSSFRSFPIVLALYYENEKKTSQILPENMICQHSHLKSRILYSKASFFLGPPATGVLLVVPAFPKAEPLPNPPVVLDEPNAEPPKPPPPKPPPPLLPPRAKLMNEKYRLVHHPRSFKYGNDNPQETTSNFEPEPLKH